MRSLSAAELLDVWEAGQDQSPVDRALALLAAACPETPPNQLATLTIGRRDAELLTLREWTFGSRVAGLASCDDCGERLDVNFQVDQIRASGFDADTQGNCPEILVQEDEYQIRCRLPTTADLESVRHVDGATARARLLERCLLSAEERGEPRTAAELPQAVVAAIGRAMSEADPQADV